MRVICRSIEEAIGFQECQNIDSMAIEALRDRGTFEKPANKWFAGHRAQIIKGVLYIQSEYDYDKFVHQGKIDATMVFEGRKVVSIKTWHGSIKLLEIREV
jgi:hypothetical protein